MLARGVSLEETMVIAADRFPVPARELSQPQMLDPSCVVALTRGEVAELRLSTGKPGNALTISALGDLSRALSVARDDARCRLIVLRSVDGDFCLGLDLELAASTDLTTVRQHCRLFWDCLEAIVRIGKPTIACVDGRSAGGGVGLAAACDIVLSAEGATFQLPEVVIGLVPALIAPFLLRRLPPSKLAYLTLSTRTIGAREAHAMGLVDEVAEGPIDAWTARLVRRLLRASPDAIAEFKLSLAGAEATQFAERKALALEVSERWLTSEVVRNALRDFSSGLAPHWFNKLPEREDRP
jgi:enoyl-CoA hydratase/carnithine racemase